MGMRGVLFGFMLAVIVAGVVAGAGCGKKNDDKKEPSAEPVPLLAPAEAARGMDACKTWVKRLCDCAKTKPALADECTLRKGRPKTLEMVLGVIQSKDTTRVAKIKAQLTAKKLIKSCIEHDNKLSNDCPRAP